MRKTFVGLGVALAMLVAHAMLAPPPSGAATGKTQGSIALIVDNAVLAGRPGGAVLTDSSDQLAVIVLVTDDGIVPMGSFALSSHMGVAEARPYDWLGEQQGSVRAIFGSNHYLANSTTAAALCAANPAVTFRGQQESAGIRKLTPVFTISFGGSSSGGLGHAMAHEASLRLVTVATSTFPQYTANSSA